MMTYAFYFILKTLFALKIFEFLSCPEFFGHVGKRLDKKAKVIFKIHDVTIWEKNNCNTNIAQYLTKQKQSDN